MKDELIHARKTIKGTVKFNDRLLVKNKRDDRINVTVVFDLRWFGGEIESFQWDDFRSEEIFRWVEGDLRAYEFLDGGCQGGEYRYD